MAHNYYFYENCVNWSASDVHREGGLLDLIEQSRPVTRRTFLSHVDAGDMRIIEEQLGYAKHFSAGLTMSADYHVEYFRSKWHGRTVYGFVHSAIEYVFVER